MSASDAAIADGGPVDASRLLLVSDYPNHFAATRPDRVAVTCDDHGSWTYAALDEACNRMAGLLRQLGIGKGERIAYIGKNNDLFYPVLIGAIRAGIVLVPVNWRNTAPETRYVLEDSNARLILADREFLDMAREADTRALPLLCIDEPGAGGLRARIAATPPLPREDLNPKAPCLQLYTSGTTGKPKGVITTQHALSIQRLIEEVSDGFNDWRDDEVLISPMPCFHVGGMSWVLCGMSRGLTVHMTADTTPANILDLCLRHGATRIFLVPTLVRALIEEIDRRGVQVKTLRSIQYGAAAMDASLLERTVDRLGVKFLQYYGMTEVTGSCTMLPPHDHDLGRPELLRSLGRPLPGFTLSIRDPDGKPVPFDTPGEIWIKGPSLLIEYWNRPDATAEALVDGWYRSGDGGRLTPQGYLYMTDRIKDMINSGGENVYPAEVESVLRDHPAVLDCAVFGLPHPRWGEGVTAAIELRPGMSVDPDELIAFARKSLAAYKVPRRVEIGVTLPRTASGKVQRSAIRMVYLDQQAS